MGDMFTAQQIEQTLSNNSLAARAMKVKLTRGTGIARMRDKQIEAQVNAQFGDDFTVTKKVFKNPNNPIVKRAKLAGEMYAYFTKYTLPHSDDGWRILPNNLYFEVSSQLANYASMLEQYDRDITSNYDHHVQADINLRMPNWYTAAAEAQARGLPQPPMPCTGDYPTLDHMKRLLYVRYYFEPISTANDFRYMVTDQDKNRLNELLMQVETKAKAWVYEQMLDPMKAFIAKLSVPIGQEGSIFRDSLVGNLNELLGRLPKLNIDGDPHVQQTLDSLKQIITPYVFNPSQLREDQTVRDNARAKMEQLAQQLEGYVL